MVVTFSDEEVTLTAEVDALARDVECMADWEGVGFVVTTSVVGIRAGCDVIRWTGRLTVPRGLDGLLGSSTSSE